MQEEADLSSSHLFFNRGWRRGF